MHEEVGGIFMTAAAPASHDVLRLLL